MTIYYIHIYYMLLSFFDMRTQRQFDTKDKENEQNDEKMCFNRVLKRVKEQMYSNLVLL